MNKKVSKTLGLVLLLMPLLPFSLVNAETVDNVPMGETTLSTVADDPLKEYKEKAATQVSTIEEEPESEQKKQQRPNHLKIHLQLNPAQRMPTRMRRKLNHNPEVAELAHRR